MPNIILSILHETSLSAFVGVRSSLIPILKMRKLKPRNVRFKDLSLFENLLNHYTINCL